MLQEERSIKRVRCYRPSAETAQDGADEARVFNDLTTHFPTISLDHPIYYIAEEGPIITEDARRFRRRGMEGVMKGRGSLAVGVEVQLVDAAARVDAPTGAA